MFILFHSPNEFKMIDHNLNLLERQKLSVIAPWVFVFPIVLICDQSPCVIKMFHLEPSPRSIEEIIS
jgi:hypothetical protein